MKGITFLPLLIVVFGRWELWELITLFSVAWKRRRSRSIWRPLVNATDHFWILTLINQTLHLFLSLSNLSMIIHISEKLFSSVLFMNLVDLNYLLSQILLIWVVAWNRVKLISNDPKAESKCYGFQKLFNLPAFSFPSVTYTFIWSISHFQI